MKPPIEDWVGMPHKVEGADADTAEYERQLPDGTWQWWYHMTEEWIDR